MSAQKISGASDKLKGSVKEAIGKLIGDRDVEAEGRAQQAIPRQEAPKSGAKHKITPEAPKTKAKTKPKGKTTPEA